jgi:hypothetical protein
VPRSSAFTNSVEAQRVMESALDVQKQSLLSSSRRFGSKPTDYELVTIWRIEAPIHEVCEAISHSHHWPKWWRGVRQVIELERGDAHGVGGLLRYTWKSLLPYRLTFDMRITRVKPLAAIEGVASGELEGTGRWLFTAENGVTTMRHEWQVRTTKRWMNLAAPIARPLFTWNHDIVMRQGGKGLARLLNARLISMARQ